MGNRRRGQSLQLAYWNKGSSHLTNKRLDVSCIIAKYKPDVLGLGEANFKPGHDLLEAKQDGYTLHLGPGLDSLGVARVAAYTRDGLVVKRRRDLEGGNVCTLWLQVGLPNKPAALLMFGYRQWQLPGPVEGSGTVAAQLERWLVLLEQWERALEEQRETICMMDANLDFLTWMKEDLPSQHSSSKLRPLTQALFTRILPCGVSQLVTTATRAERGVPVTGLDHLYTNRPDKLSEVRAEFTGMSDHKIILVRKFSKDLRTAERYTRKRMFKNFQPDQFKYAVMAMPELAACLASTSADTAASALTSGLGRILDAMAPVRTIQNRKSYVPYLSSETKALQADAKTAQETAAMTGRPEDWRQYRSLRNQKNRSVKDDERNWQQKKLSTTNNPADMWKAAKAMLGWSSAGPPTKLYHLGNYITSPAGLATTMNNFFLDKVKRLREGIPPTDVDPLAMMRESMRGRTCTFTFQPVREQQMEEIVAGLRGSKATGVDYIDVGCLKLVAREIAPCLAHITNLSVATSTFPKIYKYAKVVPLLKLADKSPLSCSSYRPVSLLPVLSRAVEKALFSQLSDYLESNNLLHPNHHGGRKNHNTTTALIQLNDEWLAAAEEGMMTGVMMTDLSAAYDLWDHKIGLEKASLMGVEPAACSWISSYISGRSQSCTVDGHLSAALKLPAYSVPQGSVGAPLLFLMANSDLPDVIHQKDRTGHPRLQCSPPPTSYPASSPTSSPASPASVLPLRPLLITSSPPRLQCSTLGSSATTAPLTGHCEVHGDSIHFVDDGTVTFANKDPQVISDVLTSHYSSISDYMAANKLVINADKTHLLVMGPRRLAGRREEVSVMAGGHRIKPTESHKLLGITVHQSMTWNQHIRDGKESVLRQLTVRVNGLRKLSNKADFGTKLMIANGIVMSKLAYGLAMWGSCQGYLRRALQVQQLTAARAVCGYQSFYWSTAKLLSTCGWLSSNQLYWQQVLTMAHKTLQSGKPINIHGRMVARHRHGTRSAAGVSRGFGGHPAHSSYNYAAQEYNSLPAELREERYFPAFKRRLRTWVQHNISLV